MVLIKKWSKRLWLLFLVGAFGITMLTTGCEDDPLLDIDTDDDCVGSYCKLAIPDDGSELLAEIINPETF